MRIDEHDVVARVEQLTLRELRLWVREGWIRPAQGEAGLHFDDIDLARARLLCALTKEMSLSVDALPVVLGLLDRLHQTRRELRCLAEALAEQPEDVRAAVFGNFRTRTGQANEGESTSAK